MVDHTSLNSFSPQIADLPSVPMLRISLLELSRNLNVVKQSRKNLSLEMRRNLDKIIDVLNESYHAMADECSNDMTVRNVFLYALNTSVVGPPTHRTRGSSAGIWITIHDSIADNDRSGVAKGSQDDHHGILRSLDKPFTAGASISATCSRSIAARCPNTQK